MADPIYKASPGFHISNKDAEILGPAFEALEKKLKRPPTPADIVKEAANPKSPWHKYFEWDDARAAIQYRLARARYLVMALDVLLPEYGDARVRGVIPTGYPGGDPMEAGGFMSTRRATATRPDVIAAQLARAKADAKAVVERHQSWIALVEFQPAKAFVEAARDLAYEG